MTVGWLPLILGFLLAGLFFLTGFRSALIKYQLMAVGFVVIGVLLSLLTIPDWLGIGIMLSSMGLMLLLSGSIALIHYLHSTQPSIEDMDGN